MSGRFVLVARDVQSCQTQDTCAAQLTHVSHVLAHVSHSVRAASSYYLAVVSSFCWLVEHFSADATPSAEDLS